MTDRLQRIKEMYEPHNTLTPYCLNDFKPDIDYLITRLEAAEMIVTACMHEHFDGNIYPHARWRDTLVKRRVSNPRGRNHLDHRGNAMSYLEERIAKALTVEMGAEFMPSDCQELAAAVMAVFREPEVREWMIQQIPLDDPNVHGASCLSPRLATELALLTIFGPADDDGCTCNPIYCNGAGTQCCPRCKHAQ